MNRAEAESNLRGAMDALAHADRLAKGAHDLLRSVDKQYREAVYEQHKASLNCNQAQIEWQKIVLEETKPDAS